MLLTGITVITGQGALSTFFDYSVKAGGATETQPERHRVVQTCVSAGILVLTITLGGFVFAAFELEDLERKGVRELIGSSASSGKHVALLSGDNVGGVTKVGRRIGLIPSHIFASQSPTSKADKITHLKTIHPHRPVAFVGAGVNDSIVLSSANISVVIASGPNFGADIAVSSSTIMLLSRNSPRSIQTIFNMSLLASIRVVASLTLCFLYYAVAILIASGAGDRPSGLV